MLGSAAGCGASSAELPGEQQKIIQSPSKAVDYEAPVQLPGILADQVGYRPVSEKAVIFRAEDPGDSFGIYDTETGKLMYTGEIQKPVYNNELGEYDSIGYFTELTKEGSYYAYSEKLGESYAFDIKNDIYSDILDTSCRKYYINRCGLALSQDFAGDSAHSACHTSPAHLKEDPGVEISVEGGWHLDSQAGRDTALGCRTSTNLLLASEMNTAAFADDTGIPESGNKIPDILDEVRYEAEWLLKMQDQKTGGIYGAAVTDQSKTKDIFASPVLVTPISMEATISFASMMAMFSYRYKEYDKAFATLCLRAADRAWDCFLNNESAKDSTMAFCAAAQLYRATGNDKYKEVLESYFYKEDFARLFESDEAVFLGAVTYLSTSQETDIDTCMLLMKYLMKRAESIAHRASESAYLVTDIPQDADFKKMLYDMRCLSIADYVIYNYEYTSIIENHVHYLMGMNPQAANFVTDDTERDCRDCGAVGVTDDPENNSLFIFMLSVLENSM